VAAFYATICAILLDDDAEVLRNVSIAYESATRALLHHEEVTHAPARMTAAERSTWRNSPENPINSLQWTVSASPAQGIYHAVDPLFDVISPLTAPLYEVRDRLVVAHHKNVVGKYQRSMSALVEYISELPRYHDSLG
jgi:hypothetical protein